jgi:hypothetical protein
LLRTALGADTSNVGVTRNNQKDAPAKPTIKAKGT